jgi:DNA polymerase-3 subunit beta
MQTTIQTEAFKHAFAHVRRFAARSTLPVLEHVKVSAVNGHIAMTATDLDFTCEASIPARNMQAGETLIPAARLADLSKSKLPEFTLETHDKGCFILQGAVKQNTLTLPVNEFPPNEQRQWVNTFTIPAATLLKLLRHVEFAIFTDKSRYVLNGVFFEFRDGTLTLAATDGRRLSMQEEDLDHHLPVTGEGVVNPSFILPSGAVKRLIPILKDSAKIHQTVIVSQAKWQTERIVPQSDGSNKTVKVDHLLLRFLLTLDGAIFDITSKAIEGNYPNYRQVIPNERKKSVSVRRTELLDAVRQAETVTTDKNNSVKLKLTKHLLTISVKSDKGEIAVPVDVNYLGLEIAWACNPGYMIDWLTAMDSDEVHLDLTDDRTPIKARTDEAGYTYVLMPMRLN